MYLLFIFCSNAKYENENWKFKVSQVKWKSCNPCLIFQQTCKQKKILESPILLALQYHTEAANASEELRNAQNAEDQQVYLTNETTQV